MNLRLFRAFWRSIISNNQTRPVICKEISLVSKFITDGHLAVEPLCDYLTDRDEPFLQSSGSLWVSQSGLIVVEDDICGYEVKIGTSNQMVDCNPAAYGLTQEEGKKLVLAVLSCVPGSTPYQDITLKRIRARREDTALAEAQPDKPWPRR